MCLGYELEAAVGRRAKRGVAASAKWLRQLPAVTTTWLDPALPNDGWVAIGGAARALECLRYRARGAQNAAAGEMQAYLDDLLASPGVAAAPPLLALLGQR
jgi:hypothetical protein